MACPAIGYVYSEPAVLAFSAPVPSDVTVSACFGECTPAELVRHDAQEWQVPQEAPYLAPDLIGDGSARTVTVTLTDPEGVTVSDGQYEIPTRDEGSGWFGQCPGTFTYEPVKIELG